MYFCLTKRPSAFSVIPFRSLSADSRALLTAYAPAMRNLSDARPELSVVVSMHDIVRDMCLVYKIGPFAEKHGVLLVVVPLFSCGT
jgi:hypothetical protein